MHAIDQGRVETQAMTIRLPLDVYEALRAYAHVTHTSQNELVVRALAEFLATTGRQEEFDMLLEQTRDRYRGALDKLAGL